MDWRRAELLGIALAWTSTPSLDIGGPRVGIPSYDTTKRQAYVSRRPGCSGRWKCFGFEERKS
jgi:hypothetical protein